MHAVHAFFEKGGYPVKVGLSIRDMMVGGLDFLLVHFRHHERLIILPWPTFISAEPGTLQWKLY